jgi:hypothetical protein
MGALVAKALQTLVPILVTKAVEAVQSKKLWASVLAFLHIQNTPSLSAQITSAAVAGFYVIGQGIHDAGKVRGAAVASLATADANPTFAGK